jgi:hypothetical protein
LLQLFLLPNQVSGEAVLVVTYEAASVQETSVDGANTFTFDDYSVGSHNDVVWENDWVSASFDVISVNEPNQYGGAYATNFFRPASTLTLDPPVSYFGMWWSAGSGSNFIRFYNGDTLLWSFDSSVINGLDSAYFGNPNSQYLGENSGQAYAYVNFFVQSGLQIDRVVGSGSGFETDNWALRDPAYGLYDGDGDSLPGTPIAQYTLTDDGQNLINTDVENIVVAVPERCEGPPEFGVAGNEGYVFNDVGVWEVGAEIDVSCAFGYPVEGDVAPSVCADTGLWDPPPGTVWSGCGAQIDCGTPDFDTFIIGEGESFLDSTRTVSCIDGYSGDPSDITCTDNSEWTTPSGCEQIGCGPPSQTGYLFSEGTEYTLGATRTATCSEDEGYTGTGSDIECQDTSEWTVSAGCAFFDCGAPDNDATYAGTTTFGASYTGSTCGDGQVGTVTVTCTLDGWVFDSDSCVADCGEPSQTGYEFEYTLTTEQNIAAAACNENAGYVGTATDIECLDSSEWTISSGCNIFDCGVPEGYDSVEGATTFGASYTGDECGETRQGTVTVTCTLEGWDITSDTCVDTVPNSNPESVGGSQEFFTTSAPSAAGLASFLVMLVLLGA